MVVEIANIVRAVNVPGTADIEAGSGALPGDVAQTVRAVLDVGAVGINLEDAWELKCVWPRAELVIVDDAGHSPDNPGLHSRTDPRDRSIRSAPRILHGGSQYYAQCSYMRQ